MSEGLIIALVGGVSAVVGGGITTLASAWLTAHAGSEEGEKQRLHDEVREMRTLHEECTARADTLERRLEVVERHHASLVPRWIKNAAKRIDWVNGAAMVSIFGPLGRGRDQVEGLTFADLFGAETIREIDRLERAALQRPGRSVSTLLQLDQQLPPMHIVCVAGIGRDSELIYEGYAHCPNDPGDAEDRGSRRQQEQLGLSSLRLPPPEPPAAA